MSKKEMKDLLDYFEQNTQTIDQPAGQPQGLTARNIVIGAEGQVIIDSPSAQPPLPPSHPLAVQCPQCQRTAGRLSEHCACGAAVKAHYDRRDQLERDRRVALLVLVIFALLFAAATWRFGFTALTPVMALPLALLGFALYKQRRMIAKSALTPD